MAKIESGVSADLLTVDATSKAARATLYTSAGNEVLVASGDALDTADRLHALAGVNDGLFRPVRVDRFGSLASSRYTLQFHEPFEATTVSSPNRITLATTTFTQAQVATTGINFNSGASAASAAAALLTTNKRFARYQRGPLHAKFRLRADWKANQVAEWGFGAPANQTTAATVGAFFQITSGGVCQGVMTFGGVDITSELTLPSGWESRYYTWDIVLDDDDVQFFVQDTASNLIVASTRIDVPNTQGRLWDATHLPAFVRLHNTAATTGTGSVYLTGLDVLTLDLETNKSWPHQLASTGFGAEVVPTTFAQAANYANSTIPSSATLSNTAAGYTTLGGQFQFAAVAGAETDYALFGFTVPAPYTLVVTGISIDTWNMGAAVATTPHLLQWFASPDQTAISLATATNRRVTLGAQYLAVSTPVGGASDKAINVSFDGGPLVTNSGRIMVIGLKMPVATATASQIIRGVVGVRGYFE